MTKEGLLKKQLLEKWKLEEKCFEDAVMKDVHGKEFKWPRNKPMEQIVFERYFLDRVVDPDSGHYYPKRDKDGLPVRTPGVDNPRYVVNTIIRIKRPDNTEFLVSKK